MLVQRPTDRNLFIPGQGIRVIGALADGVDVSAWGLVSYWKLEEASGARNDSYGTNHLTDNNTVTQAVGKIGNAAQFTAANSEFLDIADNASLSAGDVDFWCSAWVWFDSLGSGVAHRPIIHKGDGGGANQQEYLLWKFIGSDLLEFWVGNGATQATVAASSFGVPATGQWIFIFAWHDSVANTINIRVNNGAVDSTSYSSGSFNSANSFNIGQLRNAVSYHDGRIDSVGFGKSPPGGITSIADSISSTLYNSGSGLDPL